MCVYARLGLTVTSILPGLSREAAFTVTFIARHLLYTPERYSGGKFRNFPPLLSHVCPAALRFDGYRDTLDEVLYAELTPDHSPAHG